MTSAAAAMTDVATTAVGATTAAAATTTVAAMIGAATTVAGTVKTTATAAATTSSPAMIAAKGVETTVEAMIVVDVHLHPPAARHRPLRVLRRHRHAAGPRGSTTWTTIFPLRQQGFPPIPWSPTGRASGSAAPPFEEAFNPGGRHLLYHPESDSLFEVLTRESYEKSFEGPDGGLLVDVTGIHWAEYAFRNGLVPNPPSNLMRNDDEHCTH